MAMAMGIVSSLLGQNNGRAILSSAVGCCFRNLSSYHMPSPDLHKEGGGEEEEEEGNVMGILRDDVSVASLIRLCGERKSLREGKILHSRILSHCLQSNTSLQNLLVQMYGKCGRIKEAHSLFCRVNEPDIVTLNVIISVFAQNSQPKQAFHLYTHTLQQMEGLKPDKFTFTPLLAGLMELSDGKQVHARIAACEIASDSMLETALINMYGKSGSLKDSRSLFDNAVSSGNNSNNLYLWNAIIAAHTRNGDRVGAFRLFRRMIAEKEENIGLNGITFLSLLEVCADMASLAEGKEIHLFIISRGLLSLLSSVSISNALINMYGKCYGGLDYARGVFEDIPQKDVISWTTIISAYARNGLVDSAFDLFRNMLVVDDGITPNKVTFLAILNMSADSQSLVNGKWIHQLIIAHGFESDVSINTTLIDMYGKCGRLTDARAVFDQMTLRNVVSWTAMISACVRNDCGKEALLMFERMESDGIKANELSFLSVIDACANLSSFADGQAIHEWFRESGFESPVAETALVNMYGRCGHLREARAVFDSMQKRNVIAWTSMIAAYTHNGHAEEALDSFQSMILDGVKPNQITFLEVFHAIDHLLSFGMGKTVHCMIVSSGYDKEDPVLEAAILDMYGKCGSLSDAEALFNQMKQHSVISCATLIAAYAHNGHHNEALELFYGLDLKGVVLDRAALLSLLDVAGCMGSPEICEAVHKCIIGSSFHSDIAIKTSLVSMYGKYGRLQEAWMEFDRMYRRNAVSWTVMISAYAQNKRIEEACSLFMQMSLENVQPNRITALNLIEAGINSASLENARVIHRLVVSSNLESDVVISTALINMYGKCGGVNDARIMFNQMHRRNVILWNAMIAVYTWNGRGMEALQMFHEMNLEGVKPNKITILGILESIPSLGNFKLIHAKVIAIKCESDIVVQTALVDKYGKCGNLNIARAVFDQMDKHNLLSWTVMMGAYAQNGDGKEALELLKQMDLKCVKPDKVTFLVILDASASLASFANGRAVHERIVASGIELDTDLKSALISMYGKCGNLNNAWIVFGESQAPNATLWTAMITSYAQNGHAEKALQLFQLMVLEGENPDQVTFLSILHACSHVGMLDEGLHYLAAMREDYGITPIIDHYVCFTDLLGRAGYLDNAEELMYNMPFQCNPALWIAYLGAHQIHGNKEQG